MVRILFIENKKGAIGRLREAFKRSGRDARITPAKSLDDVRKALQHDEYDVVLSNVADAKFTALELLQFLETRSLHVPVLFLSETGEEEKALGMLKRSVLGVVPSNDDRIGELPSAVEQLIRRARSDREKRMPQADSMESERRYRMLFEKAKEGIVLFDAQGRLLEANPYVKEITGYEPKEFVGRSFTEFLSPEESARALEGFTRLKERGWARGEFEFRGKTGQLVILEFSTFEVDEGIYQSLFRDITERKRREAEIYEQNRVLFAIYDVASSLMESMELDEVLHTAVSKIKEVTQGQFVGIYLLDEEEKHLNLVAHSGLASRELSPISRFDVTQSLTGEAVRARRSMFVSTQMHRDTRITPQGRRMAEQEGWEGIAVIPLKAQDEILGAIDVLFVQPKEISTSERQMFTIIGSLVGAAVENARLYEQTLKKSKEIERRNRELSDFTYVVSHDLKEPLVGIEGFSMILLNQYGSEFDEKASDYLKTLAKLSSQMKGLINDLLTYARVGEEDLTKEPVNANDVIEHLKTELEYYIQQNNAKVGIVAPLPTVMYPEVALTEVFRNLISNAIKFNDKTEPVVEIGCEASANEYRFFVRDNGMGIPKEYCEKIFLIFQRLNHNERYEGSGIGLTIAKKVVESNGGSIWVQSEVGKGSTFYFTVPKLPEPSS